MTKPIGAGTGGRAATRPRTKRMARTRKEYSDMHVVRGIVQVFGYRAVV